MVTAPPAAVSAATLRAWLWQGARTLPVRILGAGLVVAAYRPWVRVHGPLDALLFAAVVLLALWAAPPLDVRPTLPSGRWTPRLARRRTTLLPCAAVLLAATATPRAVEGAATAALLTAYLAASDVQVLLTARGRARAWLEPAAALAGSVAVVAASAAPGTESAWARPVVALALGAGVTALLTLGVRRTAAARRTPGAEPAGREPAGREPSVSSAR